MSAINVIQYRDFTNDMIGYNQPVLNKAGGKNMNLYNKAAKKSLYVTTPLMMTWGISDYEGNERFEMSLQFPNDEYHDDKTRKFLQVMTDFEESIKRDAVKNSKDWFGKATMSPEVVDALWTPMLKYSKNKETGEPDKTKSPRLQVKVPKYDGVWKPSIFTMEHEKIFPTTDVNLTPMDIIHKNAKVATVIQCGGLWFANGKFGVTWRLHQAITEPMEDNTNVCQIILDDTDKDSLKASVTEALERESTTMVESDGEEDEEEEEAEDEVEAVPEPEPEPEPVKKKKVIRKKAA